MNKRKKQLEAIDKLLDVMDELRLKCPWDRKQTIKSLRSLTIEETYELSQAILDNDMDAIKVELGDILLHIIFYSKIASEKNHFDLSNVASLVTDKLIYRHPHVFDNLKINNLNDIKKNWESLKVIKENKGVLSGIPSSLPSIIKAERIQEKAAAVGFDFKKSEDVIKKIKEELNEFLDEINNKKINSIEEEFGDLFFSLINYARILDINPDLALEGSNKKFIKRFNFMEESLGVKKKKINTLDLNELNALWDIAKENA